jgi:hypothetical protein
MGLFNKTPANAAGHFEKAAPSVAPPAKAAVPAVGPTVAVPVALLQAIHAQLQGHADSVLALLPVGDQEAREAALVARTEARLKQQQAAK